MSGRLPHHTNAPIKFRNINRHVLLTAALITLSSAVITLFLVGPLAGPAEAYALKGCKYDADSISPIEYRFHSVNSAYETAFKNAESAWDSTSSPGHFSEDSVSLDPEIDVYDGVYAGTWWAQTDYSCDSDGTYSGNENTVFFDTGGMGGLTAYEKKLVAEHELGHTYGLDEAPNNGCRVMRQGSNKFTCGTMPAADDIAGVNALY